MRRIAQDVASGELTLEDVSAGRIDAVLDTAGAPHPDIIVRPGGEQRLSNFLLWQAAGAQFMALPTLWPDMSAEHLDMAIAAFRPRGPGAAVSE